MKIVGRNNKMSEYSAKSLRFTGNVDIIFNWHILALHKYAAAP